MSGVTVKYMISYSNPLVYSIIWWVELSVLYVQTVTMLCPPSCYLCPLQL